MGSSICLFIFLFFSSDDFWPHIFPYILQVKDRGMGVKIYAVKKQTNKKNNAIPSTNKGKQAFVDHSYFRTVEQITETGLWENTWLPLKWVEGERVCSAVYSSEQGWMSSNSHDVGKKKKVKVKNNKGLSEITVV